MRTLCRGARSVPAVPTTALVTGGASGIGRALGRALAARGTDVVLADSDADGVTAAAAELGATGVVLDVRDREAFELAVAETWARTGGIDLFVNNAGVSLGGPTHELTGADWDVVVDVNLRGVINGVLAVYPRMVDAGRGHIVNTASAAGLAAPPFVAPYAATKHAVVGLSTGLRPEAALHGVRVSVLCPGPVETPILDRVPDGARPSMVSARTYLKTIGQRPVDADRFARAALAAIDRNRAVIVLPHRTKALWYLQRLSPGVAGRITSSLAKKVQRELLT